ncbi:hypothetical protein, partial [Mycolicibacterium sp. CBMA 361]|uniref:hypothetical protein n=1 Tax=Mycolicibacterium sp. CBMA 361 TaxID=2606610 RepID=UPI00193EBC2D
VAAAGKTTGGVPGTVTTGRLAPSVPSTTSDDVDASYVAPVPGPGKARTTPSGAPVTAGDTAARPGEMVGGGVSAGCEEQEARAPTVSAAAANRVARF